MAMYVVSALIPLIGFVIGVAYLLSRSENTRQVGIACSTIAILPTLCALCLYSVLTSPVAETPQDDDGQSNLPASFIDKMYVNTDLHSVLCEFSAQSSDISWDSIEITLSGDGNSTTWNTSSTALTGLGVTAMRFPGTLLGNLTVWCNVTDMGGDGIIGSGDAIYMSTPSDPTFSSDVAYLITIAHKTTGMILYQTTFWGGLFGMVN